MEPRDPNAPFTSPTAPSSGLAASAVHAKADLARRFGAAAVDGFGAWVVALVLAALGGAVGARPAFYGLGLLGAAAYLLVRDGLDRRVHAPRVQAPLVLDRRSIGKRLLRLRPVRLDGGAMDVEASIRRNWTLALACGLFGLSSLASGLTLYSVARLVGYLGWAAGLLALVEAVLVITDAEGRRLGDKQANTQVIEREA